MPNSTPISFPLADSSSEFGLHRTHRADRLLSTWRISRRLVRHVIFGVAMVLQLDVPALGALALGGHAVFVRGDAGVDEEGEVDEAIGGG